jgi:acetyl-CoA/propionyl-CoA carboxylase biotin carboxyl carrier protein
MNTRIQVEHTVTELVTGVDLVREQVLVAAGEPLAFAQGDVRFRGHAIECRVNAEDPANGFLPAPGAITAYREPAGPGVRVDSGVTEGSEVVGLYDPLVAKLVVWDTDRERARRRMLRALEEYVVEGVTTLLGFHRALLEHPCFVAGETCFGLVESDSLAARAVELSSASARAPSGGARLQEEHVEVELDGRRFDVALLRPEPPHAELARRRRGRAGGGTHHAAAREAVVSPMQGTVLAVEVADGDEVREGQVICVVEAMKMENEITAHRRGTVTGLSIAAGAAVTTGQVICVVAQEGETEPELGL